MRAGGALYTPPLTFPMRRASTSPVSTVVLVGWPLIFGLTLTLLRLIVLTAFGARGVGVHELAGLLLGLPGQIAFGLLLALPLHWLHRSRARWLVYAATFAVVVINVAAFHFEAEYGRLPGVSTLYYLGEARHLAASVRAAAPWLSVIFEVGLTVGVLGLAGELLRRRATQAPAAGARRPWIVVSAAICLVSVGLTLAFHFAPSLVPRRYVWLSRVPVFWAMQSWGAQQAAEAGPGLSDRRMALELQQRIGHRIPFGGVDDRYPLCGSGPRHPWKEGNGRSVIFLILESVGSDEVRLVHQGQPVMPHLQRIAAQSLSFRRIKSAGTKSSQAMPGLFAGVLPQPSKNLLWRTPLNNLAGFPLELKNRGYRTSYFHGGDLSFEQQRRFLGMVGFEDIVELDGEMLQGWGEWDDVVLRKLERWVTANRTRPYLATLFTLSTHHPYLLPPGRPRAFAGQGEWANYLESLRFLDDELGRFYDWYLANEAPRGTLLVLTGDHVPYLSPERYTDDDHITRFDVPLLIHGSGIRPSAAQDRLGAHFDVPATILGLLDVSPGPCDQGLDLLVPEDQWPSQRAVYSVAGDDLENFHAWFDDAHVHFDLATRTSTVTSDSKRGRFTDAQVRDATKRGAELLGLAGAMGNYLVAADAFAPPPSTTTFRRAPVPRVTAPFFVAHRGQSRGDVPPAQQNKLRTIEQAVADGMDWVEVDVRLSRDEHPVLIHDPQVEGRDVTTLSLDELRALSGMSDLLTLDEALEKLPPSLGLFVEIKTEKNYHRNALLARKAASLVTERVAAGRVVMDSFSPIIASSLDQYCRCPVGVDAPSGAVEQQWVDEQVRNKLDWIYVNFRQATPELIRYAHAQGLRVAVYTVNQSAQAAHLRNEWPDAIITDRAALARELLP